MRKNVEIIVSITEWIVFGLLVWMVFLGAVSLTAMVWRWLF